MSNNNKGPPAFSSQWWGTRFFGTDYRAWIANGLEELRSIFTPNTTGVQLGNTPGTMFTPTTGEQTALRLDNQGLHRSYEMPKSSQQHAQSETRLPEKTTLAQMREASNQREAEQPNRDLDQQQQQQQGHDRENDMGMEL